MNKKPPILEWSGWVGGCWSKIWVGKAVQLLKHLQRHNRGDEGSKSSNMAWVINTAAATTAMNLFVPKSSCAYWYWSSNNYKNELRLSRRTGSVGLVHCSSHSSNTANNNDKNKGVPNSNYVVPLEKSFSSANSSYMTRPLVEILRDLNKRIPDNIINRPDNACSTFISW